MRIGIMLIWLILAYRFGKWREWRTYYPTYLFWIAGNFIYEIVFKNWLLWSMTDKVIKSPVIVSFMMVFLTFTCVTLLYLPHYPARRLYKAPYIIIWASLFTIIEYALYITGNISYDHGWTFGYSALFNLYAFSLLMLHHRKHEILAWIFSFMGLAIAAYFFQLPLEFLK